MTNLREAAQMALMELSFQKTTMGLREQGYKAIEALRAALAQPEQKPVAWITGGGKGELWWHQSVKFDVDGNLIGENPDDIPLYTAPPQREWQSLTDEEMHECAGEYPWTPTGLKCCRAIEAKLKEKNT